MPAQPKPIDQLLATVQTYEDYLSAFIQLDQSQSGLLWVKADIIAQMQKKLGSKSLTALAHDIHQPPSTIINYARTAAAFGPDERDENVSFSLHYQASLVDSYDSKTGQFEGNRRFDFLHQAIVNNWSTRMLADKIQEEKKPKLPEPTDESYQEARDLVAAIKSIIGELCSNVKNNTNKDKSLEALKAITGVAYEQKANTET